MRLLIVLITLVQLATVQAQERVPCRVRFRDKGPDTFRPGSDLYERTLSTYHQRAIERRRSVGFDPILNSEDQPLHAPYKEAVAAVSDSLLAELVWMNSIIVGLTTDEQKAVATLPFVAQVIPTSSVSYTLVRDVDCSPSRYGFSSQQLSVINVQQLHDAGIFGEGARIGIIDNGFRWREMSTLRHANVEAEYDFIFRDTVTSNDSVDVESQDAHGSMIFSVVGAWSHDTITGVAPFATYLLAKSEDMRYERRIEEELFVAALHWLERSGADVSSSSLGYFYFDVPDESTPYKLLDGKTTFASRAINLASQRGMLCVTAAGNYGRSRSLITPADADSAITVGAMALNADTLWAYSSKGPTADGRIKPDITAQGMAVYCQTPAGNIVRSSGTSLATPIVAGQLGILRGLYPDLALHQLREALYTNSRFPTARDSGMGHGVASTFAAAKYLGPGIGRPNIVQVPPATGAFVPVFCSNPVRLEVIVRNRATMAQWTLVATPIESPWYYVSFPDEAFTGGDTLDIRLIATDSVIGRVRAFPYDQYTFPVVRNMIDLACGVKLPTSITSIASGPEELASGFVVHDQPLPAYTRTFSFRTPEWAGVSHSIRVTTLDGREIAVTAEHESGTVHVNTATPMPSGLYVVTIASGAHVASIPLVVH